MLVKHKDQSVVGQKVPVWNLARVMMSWETNGEEVESLMEFAKERTMEEAMEADILGDNLRNLES